MVLVEFETKWLEMFRTDDNSMSRYRELQRLRYRELQRARAIALPYMPCACDKACDMSRESGVTALIWTIFAALVAVGHNLTKGGWP